MKKLFLITVLLAGGIVLLWQASRVFQAVSPAITPPPEDIREIIQAGVNETDFPLTLPNGFSIEIFAENLPKARVMARDDFGNLWVSQTHEGTITQLVIVDGRVVDQTAVFRNLNRPHGLAFDPQNPLLLYIAEEDRISRVQLYSDAPLEKIADLPRGGRHFTRSLLFVGERLYVSIGSTCDTCLENDERLAAVISMNRDGGDMRVEASGLRNAVFLTQHPATGVIWATEMGRDHLGDDLPPDEVNIIREGRDYGWPNCYGQNVLDMSYDSSASCAGKTPSTIDLQAHSAPLGLTFIPPNSDWPEDYWYDLIVAFHGSWNRSVPTGYKLYRYRFDKQGNLQGEVDFITGWLQGSRALGRPVDILIEPDGMMYVSDDHAGVIYKISYNQ